MSAPMDFMPATRQSAIEQYDVTFAFGSSRDETRRLLPNTDVWVTPTCPTYRVDAGLLDAARALRVLATPTTGTTHIDTDDVARRGIRLITLKGSPAIETIQASSEFSFALLMALLKKMPRALEAARAGVWRTNEAHLRSRELHGLVLGLIGYGRIGRNMARYGAAFGMTVVACDPFVDPAGAAPGVRFVTQSELLATADVVGLHVHLSDDTRGMIGRDQFAAMHDGAYFLNTARGELVDEVALLDALATGKLAGAAVDVISGENTVDSLGHPLLEYAREHDHLIVTPHVAGLTVESETKAMNETLRQIALAL
jgi:phosphoglycerate dehydrogenase-like enzyme